MIQVHNSCECSCVPKPGLYRGILTFFSDCLDVAVTKYDHTLTACNSSLMQRGADGGGPVLAHDNDLASPPLWPRTAAAHPARQLRTGTELGVKRALSFPPSDTLPSTPPCSPKLNLSAVETPMPKRQRSHAPNAPQRNPLRADHRAPAGATIVDTPWRARHGRSGRVASRVRDAPSRTLDESICDAVGLRQRDRRLNRPAPRSTTTD